MTPTPQPPKTIGDYRLTRPLGKGGMGLVFQGLDKEDHPVAVKLIGGEVQADIQAINRFLREARLAQKLVHPNLVRLIDFGREGKYLYLVLEYVEGTSLRERIETRGVLDTTWSLNLLLQIARGLKVVHDQRIIHRDVKPDNILLCTRDDTAKLADLGLAKDLGDDVGLTMTGAVIGSPYYLSPEACRDSKGIDLRADIYSLGITFYHMVTGSPPITGRTPLEIIDAVARTPLPSIQSITPFVSDHAALVIGTMTARNREQRYPNCQELIEDLELVLAKEAPAHTSRSYHSTGVIAENAPLKKEPENGMGSRLAQALQHLTQRPTPTAEPPPRRRFRTGMEEDDTKRKRPLYLQLLIALGALILLGYLAWELGYAQMLLFWLGLEPHIK